MNPKLVELRELTTARLTELTDLGQKAERSDDDETRIDALIAELNELGPQIEREQQITSTAGKLAGFTQSNGTTPFTTRTVDPGTGKAPDTRSLAERFANSDEVVEYRKHPTGKSLPFSVDGDQRTFFPGRGRRSRMSEQRSLIYSGGLPASATPPQIVPGIYGPTDTGFPSLRDVLNVGVTTADAITYIAETGYTNSAAEVAEATSVSTGAKPESALTLTEVTVPIATIAHWIPITRQAMDDVGQLRAYVEGRLLDGLENRENRELLVGDGVAPNIRGLENFTGVQNLDATYFTANPVAGAGTGVENYNRALRGMTAIQYTGKARPSFFVINPADWETMISAVNANGIFYAGGPFGVSAPTRLWGLPAVVTPDQPAKTLFVGDGSMATIWDRMSAQIFISDSHADFFIRNIFVLLAEERVTIANYRPAAFAKVLLV
jgi:HK97 family phage major capsid protein